MNIKSIDKLNDFIIYNNSLDLYNKHKINKTELLYFLNKIKNKDLYNLKEVLK